MDSPGRDSAAAQLLSPLTEKAHEFSQAQVSRVRRNRRTTLWAGLGLLAVVVLLAAVVVLPGYTSRRSFLPTVTRHGVVFTEDLRFLRSPHGKDSPWRELEPQGRGFVKVPPEMQEGIGASRVMEDGSGEYCMSVFHQLHCLAILRGAFNVLRENETVSHGGDAQDEQAREMNLHHLMHVDHCLDYLRQAVMCNGDMTLEHFGLLPNGTMGPGVNGYEVKHQCKSWDHIMDFATKHRSSDEWGIL